jgi:hypothetical protein
MPNQITPIKQFINYEQFCSAKVVGIQDDLYQIKIDNVSFQAVKAFSCLIRPDVNDIVQITFMENKIFILNILTRETSEKAYMDLPENIMLNSQGEISIQAKKLTQQVLDYELISEKATLSSETLHFVAQNLHQLSAYNRIKTKQLFKSVSEFEQSVSKELRMIIQDHWRVDSQSIHMLSEEDATVDARTISLG